MSPTDLSGSYLSTKKESSIDLDFHKIILFKCIPSSSQRTEADRVQDMPLKSWVSYLVYTATELQVVHFGSCLQSPGKSSFIVVPSDIIMIQVPGLISVNS